MTEINYKSEYVGKGGISARVVAHSKSAYSGKEIVTFEYEMPKCILAELNTHRLFSRNAQSSRAVPISKVIEMIRTNPVTPIHWGSNQAGMVAGEEINTPVKLPREYDVTGGYTLDNVTYCNKEVAWENTASIIAVLMESWEDAGYHKQIVNRIGEAFTFVRGVITATELDNFFHLRIHPAADPFMKEVARCMWEALQLSEAEVLSEGEWHTPYVDHSRYFDNTLHYGHWIGTEHDNTLILSDISLERAKQISAVGCAQVSFRKLDLTDETVDRVYSRLVDEETPHASCVEHQATPLENYMLHSTLQFIDGFEDGVSHVDRDLNFWSGNFKHWIQNRKLIPNESCNEYKGNK